MRPEFWKVSHGAAIFNYQAILDGLNERLVYVHKDTAAKGTSQQTQGEDFIHAPIGDYFYLTHGNERIYVLGQFSGPTNVFSKMGDGWLDRPYRPIKSAISRDGYSGPHKWWAANDNSTFTPVPDEELGLFEEYILTPYFDVKLSKFGIT
jgi:5-methylcytosine-specific restriction protein B